MHNHPNVLLWTDNPGPYLDAIRAAGLADRMALDTLGRNDSPNSTQIAETTVLLAAGAPPGLLSRMRKLHWAQSLTAGVEGWLALPDLPPALTLTCARGTHAESMPENILGALFHIGKPFAAINQDQQQSLWRPRIAPPLNGLTLGILGLGAIGQEVARLASALRMTVIGTKRRPEPLPGVSLVLPPIQTEQVLTRSDFLLLLLPATLETENFINAERLDQMKQTAWLLNFGRGAVVDDDALVAAMRSGRIAGAVLDVFRQEPLPRQHAFWTTPGIMVLPHIGGPHPDRDSIVARLFVANLRRFLEGQPLAQVVDRAAGY